MSPFPPKDVLLRNRANIQRSMCFRGTPGSFDVCVPKDVSTTVSPAAVGHGTALSQCESRAPRPRDLLARNWDLLSPLTFSPLKNIFKIRVDVQYYINVGVQPSG